MGKSISSKMDRWLCSLLVLFLIITACQQQERVLSFETIAKSDASDIGLIAYKEERPALLVIAKTEEIDDLIQNMLAGHSALADQLRQLDYDRLFAILVLQGLKGQGGHSVTVQEVSRQGSQVIVRADFVSPALGTRRIQAFTSPYHLVAVSKEGDWEQQVRFVLAVNDESAAETSHFIP